MKKIKTLLFSCVPLILAIAVQIVAALCLLPFPINSEDDYMMIVSIVFALACILIFSLWYFKKHNPNIGFNIKTDCHSFEILGLVLLVPGSQFTTSIIAAILSMIFPTWLEDYMNLIESAGLAGEVPLLMMIYSVILAPISEELIFRGVTLSIAKKAFPFWFANIIQAFFFGLFHMNPLQSCYTFILGLLLGYICEKGGSIYHVIFFHFLFNLWGTTASEWLLVDNELLQGLIILIGSFGGLIGGLHFFRKGNRIKKDTSGCLQI